jgi:hypothetical protein
MNLSWRYLAPAVLSAVIIGVFAGCESTGGNSNVSGYYGVGFYDPWYYGDYHYDGDVDVIVTPPDRPVRPEHPIANPPSTPSVQPLPSIPSTPRPAPRPARR